ncbi:MAG: TetR family transcriptional regulator C-terminal domain-containing protein [Geminicoccaceae bacterium]
MTRRAFHHEPEDVRRQALIDATLDAVADLGLPGANVREVAARASVTPGLIRHYFQSKDRLVEAAYTAFITEMIAEVRRQVGEGRPAERLERLVRASCSEPLASSRHIAIWAAFVGAAHTDAAMARVHRDGYRSFRQLLEEIIADLGTERCIEIETARISRQAIAVNAIIDGIWLEVSLDRAAFDGIDIMALALESILAMLRMTISQGAPA